MFGSCVMKMAEIESVSPTLLGSVPAQLLGGGTNTTTNVAIIKFMIPLQMLP